MSFLDKVVLVTGAGKGIGACAAVRFAAEGAALALVDSDASGLSRVADECQTSNVLKIVADISLDEDIKNIIDTTIQRYGKLDVLVNSAWKGTYVYNLAHENFMREYDILMTRNLRAMVYITHLAAPHLFKTKGNILFMSSILGKRTSRAVYAISKAGVNYFTQAVAGELGEKGVRVNAILTAFVGCHLPETFLKDESQMDFARNRGALRKIAEAEDIADMITYLTSDKAASVTGSLYIVDNGISSKGF